MDQEIRALERELRASPYDESVEGRYLHALRRAGFSVPKAERFLPEEAKFEETWWHARWRYFFLWFYEGYKKEAPIKTINQKHERWQFKCRRNSKRKTLRTHRDGSRR